MNTKSTAERSRKYRQRIKILDPNFMERERLRQAERRKNRNDEQKERDKETARLRMQKLRAKRKQMQEKPQTTNNVKKPMTRHKHEEYKEKWREAQRKYRDGLSSQKKRRIREKERERKRLKKLKMTESSNTCAKTPIPEEPIYSPEAERKAVYRAKKKLPKDPHKFAHVINRLITRSTPRKRKAVESKMQIITPTKRKRLEFCEKTLHHFKETFQKLKKSRKSKDTKSRKILATQLARIKKYRLLSACSKEVGIRYNTLLRWSQLKTDENNEFPRKKRSDAMPEEAVEEIKDFYVKPIVSVTHSSKKTVLKKSMTQKQTMNFTLQEAHSKFVKENHSNVSFSKFASLKPKYVETVSKRQYRGCLCEQCTNIELYLKVINSKIDKEMMIKDKYLASSVTLCNTEKPQINCVKRNCEKCGVNLMRQRLMDLEKSNCQTKWYQWEIVKEKKPKSELEQSRMKLVTHTGTFAELVEGLLVKLESFSYHLFVAHWQHSQFIDSKKGLEKGQVVCVMDFAENMTIRNQDECQSAHWGALQVTIHPVVCYFLEEDETEKSRLVTHEVVYISDDLTHDADMVQKCVSQTIELLNKSGNQIDHMIQFTDGCSCQYKSKVPFADISQSFSDHNIKIERHFFGTGHGKGPADGCAGVVKSAVTRAIKGHTVINSAKEMFNFCQTALTKSKGSFRRTFLYVDSKQIARKRSRRQQAKPIKGTRQLHAVKAVQPGVLAVRNLSCCCNSCKSDNSLDKCPNKDTIDEWKLETVLNVPQLKKTTSESVRMESQTPVEKTTTTTTTRNRKKSSPLKNDPRHIGDHTDNSDRQSYFQDKLNLLRSFNSYHEVENNVQELLEECNRLYGHVNLNSAVAVIDNFLTGDALALSLIDGNLPDALKDSIPVNVLGDGNCLPRSASVLAFGTEENHVEIRYRIILELIKYSHLYLDIDYISRGLDIPGKEAKFLTKTYAMFSEYYVPGCSLDTETIKDLFKCEVLGLRRKDSYMGIWEMLAVTSVLGCQMFSVYPSLGAKVAYETLNRLVIPRQVRTDAVRGIMWTTTRSDMKRSSWIPNHFVPIIPITAPGVTPIEILGSEEDSLDIDLLDYLIDQEPSPDSESNPDATHTYSDGSRASERTPPTREKIPTDKPIVPEPDFMSKERNSQEPSPESESNPDATHTYSDGSRASESTPPTREKIPTDKPIVPEPDFMSKEQNSQEPSPESESNPDATHTYSDGSRASESTPPTREKIPTDKPIVPEPDFMSKERNSQEPSPDSESNPDATHTYSDGSRASERTPPTREKIPTDKPIVPEPDFMSKEQKSQEPSPDSESNPDATHTYSDGSRASESTPPTREKIPTDKPIVQVPEVTSKEQNRFKTGVYIKVQHGNDSYPAVVDDWPWIRYFSLKKQGLWAINEIRHTVRAQDVEGIIQSPDIVMCGGTRLLYRFKDTQIKLKTSAQPSLQIN